MSQISLTIVNQKGTFKADIKFKQTKNVVVLRCYWDERNRYVVYKATRLDIAREENSYKEAELLQYFQDTEIDSAPLLYESFCTTMKFYSNVEEKCHVIITEYVPGGDMLDRLNKEITTYTDISKNQFIPNLVFKVDVIQQVLKMCDYLHSHQICHLDVTLENVVLRNDDVVIIDYGLAVDGVTDWKIKKNVCKPYYTSPEIIRDESYDARKRDVWCVGLCFFALVSHRYLIYDTTKIASILQLLDNGFENYLDSCRIDYSYWPKSVLSFLSLCLQSNPDNRPLPADLLCHKIFSKTYSDRKETIISPNPKLAPTLEKRTKSNNTIATTYSFF